MPSTSEWTLRQRLGYVNIVGAASATATNVNVNNTLAYRRGEYYRVELSTNNGSAAVWLGVTNRVVQNGTTNNGNVAALIQGGTNQPLNSIKPMKDFC